MIRVGVIGLGMMGQLHLAAWAKVKGARVTLAADSDPRRAAGDLSGSWSNLGGSQPPSTRGIRWTADPLQLIHSPEVDAVDICVPTPFHAGLALAALKAGKHVLCEKPLARTAAEARQLARAAAKSPAILMPAMCIRFWPEWAWLKHAVQRASHGKVIAAHFRRIGSMPPGWFARGEWSGGAVLDLHLHDTDFIHHVFGMPQAVSSAGWNGPSGCLDHIHTRYVYQDGPVVTAEGSWAADPSLGFEMSYRVFFEHATADYRLDRADSPLILHRKGRALPVKCAGGDGYLAEIACFARCIRGHQPPDPVTPDHAADSIRIVEAEITSALRGKPVRL